MKSALLLLTLATPLALPLPVGAQPAPKPSNALNLELLATHTTGQFDESAAEIVAHDPVTQRLFIVNAQAATVDVLDISNPSKPVTLKPIDVSAYGAVANSVDVRGGVVAVAVENAEKTQPGQVAFFDADGALLSQVEVGALPDMLTFTPDGRKVLVANEGEPSDDYKADPEGSISVIDVSKGAADVTQKDVTTAGFKKFTKAGIDSEIRIFGLNATVAQDLEPEYIAVSSDSKTAWVSLQENNAFALLDIDASTVTDLVALGYKDHSLAGNALDPSNEDGGINLSKYSIWGMYQPDGIAAFRADGQTYLISANEGDGRDYDGYSEEASVGDEAYVLDAKVFPNAAELKDEAKLGALTVTTALGDTDSDGQFEKIYAFGGRSFSVWDSSGTLVFDSGDALERLTAAAYPEFFNANNDENGSETFDSRSDNKGPEPEGVVIGEIAGQTYAFIGLERIGGVVIFDVSDPTAPVFVDYTNNRDFSADIESEAAGDLGPEGLTFITAKDSPTGKPLLVVANEVSGSTSVYAVTSTATSTK